MDCSYPLQQSRPERLKSNVEPVDDPDEASMMDTQQGGDTMQMAGNVTTNPVDFTTTDDQLRPDPSRDHNGVPQFDGQNDSSHEASIEEPDHNVPEPHPHQAYPPPEPPQPESKPYRELAPDTRSQFRSNLQGS